MYMDGSLTFLFSSYEDFVGNNVFIKIKGASGGAYRPGKSGVPRPVATLLLPVYAHFSP